MVFLSFMIIALIISVFFLLVGLAVVSLALSQINI